MKFVKLIQLIFIVLSVPLIGNTRNLLPSPSNSKLSLNLSNLSKLVEVPALEYHIDTNKFSIGQTQGFVIEDQNPIHLNISQKALNECRLDQSAISIYVSELRNIFKDSRNLFWNDLVAIDPNIISKTERQGFSLTLDRFVFENRYDSAFVQRIKPDVNPNSNPDSNAILKSKSNFIFINCTLLNSNSWKAMLAHELIHYDLKDLNFPSWFEEGLAQIIETEIAPEHLENSKLQNLKNLTELPSPLMQEKPIVNVNAYGVNNMLLKYLMHLFGKKELLAAFHNMIDFKKQQNNLHANTGCFSKKTEIEQLLCYLTFQLGNNNMLKQFSDPNVLMRSFIVSLVLDMKYKTEDLIYNIPQWSGFNSNASQKQIKINEIGEFQRLSPTIMKQINFNKSKNEFFRVLWNDSDYLILEGADISNTRLWQKYHSGIFTHDEIIQWRPL